MQFKQKYTLKQRKQKYLRQIQQTPGNILVIAQKLPKSNLPEISPKFFSEKHFKFNVIKKTLSQKIKQKMDKQKQLQQGQCLFYVDNKLIRDYEQTMQQIYDKHKDEDGFLYIKYGRQKDFKKLIYQPYFPILFTIAGVILFAFYKSKRTNENELNI